MTPRSIVRSLKRFVPEKIREGVIWSFEKMVWQLPEETALKIFFLRSHGFWPDFNDPRSHSEKMMAMRLARPAFGPYVDKVEVKKWVADRIGEKHIIPTLYSGTELPRRDQRKWPIPFIIKANNGSGAHVIVREEPDWDEIEEHFRDRLALDYGKATGEWFYSDVEPQLLVEPLLGGDEHPAEYKLFMFGEKVGLIVANSEHGEPTIYKQDCFDEHWNLIKLDMGRESNPATHQKPHYLPEILRIARKLSEPFAAVRVDMYWHDDQVWFSELTFTGGKGLIPYNPPEFDFEIGALWDWSRPFIDENR